VAKIKIDIKKPQYLIAKETKEATEKRMNYANKLPFFFRMLLVSSYLLSCIAIWYVYQKFNMPS